jgi:hypothetical protein
MPFATSPVLKQHWLPNIRLSTRTVRNRLKSAGLKSRRVIKRLLLVHRKGELAGCSLGYRLYFCASKPSSGRRLHEAETGSRLTNGSCAMSLNSNHVVLNTMPNVIVDVVTSSSSVLDSFLLRLTLTSVCSRFAFWYLRPMF